MAGMWGMVIHNVPANVLHMTPYIFSGLFPAGEVIQYLVNNCGIGLCQRFCDASLST